MSSGWMLKKSRRLGGVIAASLVMSGVIQADQPQAADNVAPMVTLRAELRVMRNGSNTYQYVPATVIEAGQEIDYTVRITNTDEMTLPASTVVQALPTNTHYVADSATGAGADIQFSVDGGQSFAKPNALHSPANADRIAAAAEYTHIRWQLRYPLAPKAVVLARFRAVFD